MLKIRQPKILAVNRPVKRPAKRGKVSTHRQHVPYDRTSAPATSSANSNSMFPICAS